MKVFSNNAVSLDGRIATVAYDHVEPGSRVDRAYMSVLRARADAVLVGGRTFRNWPLPLVPDLADIEWLKEVGFPDTEVPELEGRSWWNVVISRGQQLPTEGRIFRDQRVRPLFFSGDASLQMPAEVLPMPTDGLTGVITELQRRGVQNLLVEGGGDLLFQLVAANLVDEINVTICPRLIGGKGAPSLIDGAGFGAGKMRNLSIDALIRFGDELYGRYRVERAG